LSRLSQAIAEGDGISVLVEVADGHEAAAAEQQGADAVAVGRGTPDLRDGTQLPVLLLGELAETAGVTADAVVVPPDTEAWDRAQGLGIDCVVRVAAADDLERALEELDPEVFLLSPEPDSDEDVLESLLSLLHDVPAGKLAIAELRDASADEVAELERAGVDAVLVTSRDVAALVPAEPPEV
jgi:indole-3-glycerol phosphate synthase